MAQEQTNQAEIRGGCESPGRGPSRRTSAPPGHIPVSVLILARDEEANLPRCLSALSDYSDVVVVDDYSKDRTAALALEWGARVVQRRFDTFASQRNWALDSLEWQNEWVLHLDADEVVTPELNAEIGQAAGTTSFDAYRIPSKLIFMERWLRHAATYPTYQVRLGRNPGLRFKQVGHGQREDLDSRRIGELGEPYLHFNFSKGLDEWIDKHNRYSMAEALEMVASPAPLQLAELMSLDPLRRRRALKSAVNRVPCRPALRFLWLYVLRGGFLEGRPGLTYCRLMAAYEAMIVAKAAVLRQQSRSSGAALS